MDSVISPLSSPVATPGKASIVPTQVNVPCEGKESEETPKVSESKLLSERIPQTSNVKTSSYGVYRRCYS